MDILIKSFRKSVSELMTIIVAVIFVSDFPPPLISRSTSQLPVVLTYIGQSNLNRSHWFD